MPADLAELHRLRPSNRYRELIDAVAVAHQAWVTDAARPELAAMAAGNVAAARAIESSGIGRTRFDALRRRIAALQTAIDNDLTAAANRINDALTQLLLTLLVLAALTVLMAARERLVAAGRGSHPLQ